MTRDLVLVIATGIFTLTAGLGGVAISAWSTRRSDERRVAAQDARRWLADRRDIYSRYLGLVEAMLSEVDGVAVLLSYDGAQLVSEQDEAMTDSGLHRYWRRWEDDLQPALGEARLIASPRVSDLADRVSGALMELTVTIEQRGVFTDHYPMWFQSKDLVGVLRGAMREELGLRTHSPQQFKRSSGWPWLPERPPRGSYVQTHS